MAAIQLLAIWRDKQVEKQNMPYRVKFVLFADHIMPQDCHDLWESL